MKDTVGTERQRLDSVSISIALVSCISRQSKHSHRMFSRTMAQCWKMRCSTSDDFIRSLFMELGYRGFVVCFFY